MRFPVIARRANPLADRPIIRKSKSYVLEQVASLRAVWVDPADPKKGIICQELLYFGYRPLPPLLELTSTNTLTLVELPAFTSNPQELRMPKHGLAAGELGLATPLEAQNGSV